MTKPNLPHDVSPQKIRSSTGIWFFWLLAAGALVGLYTWQSQHFTSVGAVKMYNVEVRSPHDDLVVVSKVLVHLGDHVTKGQALVELRSDLLQQELRNAELAINDAEANLKSENANLSVSDFLNTTKLSSESRSIAQDIAQISADKTARQQEINELTIQLDHASQQLEQRLINRSQYDAIRLKKVEAEAALASLVDQYKQLSRAKKNADQERRQLQTTTNRDPVARLANLYTALETAKAQKQQILDQIAQLTVRAPADGIIADLSAVVDSSITNYARLAIVVSDTEQHVVVCVSLDHVEQLQIGMRAFITPIQGSAYAYTGVIESFGMRSLDATPESTTGNSVVLSSATGGQCREVILRIDGKANTTLNTNFNTTTNPPADTHTNTTKPATHTPLLSNQNVNVVFDK